MNRRGFLGAVGVAGLFAVLRGSADGRSSAARDGEEEIDRLIRRALRERRVLEFRYHGHGRVAAPHALGTVGEGRAVVLAWQSAGGSESEPPPGWRSFFLSGMERVVLTDRTFLVREDYDRSKTSLKTIEAEVARR